jgi:hypothetical protein
MIVVLVVFGLNSSIVRHRQQGEKRAAPTSTFTTTRSDNNELQQMIKKLRDEGVTSGGIPTPEGPKQLTVEEFADYLIKKKNGTLPQRQQEWNRHVLEKHERMQAEQLEALRQRENEKVQQMARRKLMEDEEDKCYLCVCDYVAYQRAIDYYYQHAAVISVYECKGRDGKCRNNEVWRSFDRNCR